MTKNPIKPNEYQQIYQNFNAPIAALDCGKRCAPHNVGGKPFCCDIRHAVPTAYNNEWAYIEPKTDLWQPWQPKSHGESEQEAKEEFDLLRAETPDNMVLLECLGPDACQRDFRAITCRQFPFFPYVDSDGKFIGISYYWEYEEECWVISNLDSVTSDYLQEFVNSFDLIFSRMPEELETYQFHAGVMREAFNKMERTIPLIHRDGKIYQINAKNEAMRNTKASQLPKYGPYEIMAEMPFPDEIE